MPVQTKTFRIFVSSTFSDMREERRILQRDVFPRLTKYCEQNGAQFQADTISVRFFQIALYDILFLAMTHGFLTALYSVKK